MPDETRPDPHAHLFDHHAPTPADAWCDRQTIAPGSRVVVMDGGAFHGCAARVLALLPCGTLFTRLIEDDGDLSLPWMVSPFSCLPDDAGDRAGWSGTFNVLEAG